MAGPQEPVSFEGFMTRGDQAHQEQRYGDALQDAVRGYLIAPLIVDQGRAARGAAWRWHRLGDDSEAARLVADAAHRLVGSDEMSDLPDSARGWLDMAMQIHGLVLGYAPDDPQALRERGYDRIDLGRMGALDLMGRMRSGEAATTP